MHQTVGCIDYLKAPLDEINVPAVRRSRGELHKTTNYIILHPRLLLWTADWNYGYLKHYTKSNKGLGGI